MKKWLRPSNASSIYQLCIEQVLILVEKQRLIHIHKMRFLNFFFQDEADKR
jgi:hypothetical protein